MPTLPPTITDPHICPTPCPADDHWWHADTLGSKTARGIVEAYEAIRATDFCACVSPLGVYYTGDTARHTGCGKPYREANDGLYISGGNR